MLLGPVMRVPLWLVEGVEVAEAVAASGDVTTSTSVGPGFGGGTAATAGTAATNAIDLLLLPWEGSRHSSAVRSPTRSRQVTR